MNSMICDAWLGVSNSSVASGTGEGGERVVVDDWGLESPEEGESIAKIKSASYFLRPSQQ